MVIAHQSEFRVRLSVGRTPDSWGRPWSPRNLSSVQQFTHSCPAPFKSWSVPDPQVRHPLTYDRGHGTTLDVRRSRCRKAPTKDPYLHSWFSTPSLVGPPYRPLVHLPVLDLTPVLHEVVVEGVSTQGWRCSRLRSTGVAQRGWGNRAPRGGSTHDSGSRSDRGPRLSTPGKG